VSVRELLANWAILPFLACEQTANQQGNPMIASNIDRAALQHMPMFHTPLDTCPCLGIDTLSSSPKATLAVEKSMATLAA
jgi:hypothetical protein